MTLENPCFRILEENCIDYRERRKLYDILENNSVDIGEKMISNLYEKTLNKADIDFADIPLSKGDIEKCRGYILMTSSLSVLSSLTQQSKVKIPEIMEIQNTINYLRSNKNTFERAFKMQSDALMMYYNTLVYSCIEATSVLLSNYVDYVKTPNNINMVIKKGSVDGSLGEIAFNNIRHFNETCKNGQFSKLSNQLLTGDVSKTSQEVISESVMGTVGAGILIATSLIPILRTVIYYFYYSKMAISQFLEQQSYFLQMNEANVNATISDARKRKDIIKKQNELIKRFDSLSDKIKINDKVTKKKVNNEIKNENKNWTLDTVKNDNFGLL